MKSTIFYLGPPSFGVNKGLSIFIRWYNKMGSYILSEWDRLFLRAKRSKQIIQAHIPDVKLPVLMIMTCIETLQRTFLLTTCGYGL